MKKAFNNLWPFTKKISSRYSGLLEVTWLNGKKILNSKNANYSYGPLEKVLDHGLSLSKAEKSSEILVLGLGGGNVLELLRKKFKYTGKITAVEIDPAVVKIALTEFNINQFEPLELVCEDALEYVQRSSAQYGLIIIDIFIDIHVPLHFFSPAFWNNITILLQDKGEVIFNAGIGNSHLAEIETVLREVNSIDLKKLEDVMGTNTLLLGIKK